MFSIRQRTDFQDFYTPVFLFNFEITFNLFAYCKGTKPLLIMQAFSKKYLNKFQSFYTYSLSGNRIKVNDLLYSFQCVMYAVAYTTKIRILY